MMGRRIAALFAGALLGAGTLCAQGVLSGSLESSSIYDVLPGSSYNGVHANNYLKLDYRSAGSFYAGVQAEWYPSPLPGFDPALQGIGVPLKFVGWDARDWNLTLGDFYQQFGSGLILRSWEDRDLGLGNSLGGVRAGADFFDKMLSVTVLSGVPRAGLGYAKSLVSGADANLTLGEFSLGGSVVDRWEWAPDGDMALLLGGQDAPANVLLFSGRAGWDHNGLHLSAEYVGKGRDFTAVRRAGESDSYRLEPGRAVTAELSYARGGFSATATWRYLYNMGFASRRTLGTRSISNTLNYLPALCQQQTYMLACLNPYETFAEGENGFRGDLYYRFKRNSALGGRYGMTLHVGGSWINALGKVLPLREKDYLAYRDINIDLERRWSSKFKTTLFVSIQENSPTHGNRKATNAQNVFVFEGLYKFSSSCSLRWELQYLYSQELSKDWMAALVELGLAPHWSFSLSDMYNHGSTGDHYWSANVSYSLESFKVLFAYGRNRAGMVCSGGVCRYQPEYQGASLRAQWSF